MTRLYYSLIENRFEKRTQPTVEFPYNKAFVYMERDVLKEYLEREEAAAVMFTFADQVEAMNEALSTERAEGEKKGVKKQMEEDAKGMYAEGIKPDVIAKIQKVSVDVIEKILGLHPTR